MNIESDKLDDKTLRVTIWNELHKEQLLGFDYVSQALAAVLEYEDFASRWDIEHNDYLCDLLYTWKARKLYQINLLIKRA